MSDQHSEAMGPPVGMAYRTPTGLPFEIAEHTGIFFEEQLYTQALTLLFNTLASGTYASKTVIAPLPEHLALACTFLVHPSTTNRAKKPEQQEAPQVALRLLRLISTLITPKDAGLGLAFSFKLTRTSRSGRLLHADDASSSPKDVPHDKIPWQKLDVANESSLWSRAEDFWHAVGWAFNCSVLHPERWEHWQTWLRFMCDILLDDWEQREQEYEELLEKKSQEEQEETTRETTTRKGSRSIKNDDLAIFRESMLFRYIYSGRHGKNRRIVRAIFADGSTPSVNEFRQVFAKELKHSKSKSAPEKAKKRKSEVNIDEDKYGDYLSQDESDEESTEVTDQSKSTSRASSPPVGAMPRRSKRTRRGTRTTVDPTAAEPVQDSSDTTTLTQHSGGVSTMGGLKSLGLRKKLLGLLSKVSERLEDDFMPVSELYYLFVENIRPLPLPIFQTFVSPYILPELPDDQQTTLCQSLLETLRQSSAPSMHEEWLDQVKLETCFLPFAATTSSAADNAKVSIALEALVILLANGDLLTMTPEFKESVERGILQRASRVQDDMRRSIASRNKESLEWCWLVESGDRLMFLVEMLALRGTQ
ncbi:hypothetical protein N7448_004775 [Penicillium atrosanguineum]|uniref:Uncharacterized protein n=1 Tax=Penicillium atrosanguineum TaxID=1132637 RepID=A0A9W9H3J9_9EURO|nr:uncharacterized protein N7443_008524 [Penicillium atrosanguineum]KAJ5125455.1 hypothetical protein N7526_007632 [Penicillium atrosanguineum]KAJ5136221.1 hypothetical protein N7448_004775 [Penicillium atrosanguineum]KAJ5292571.1 hypothetical protein N7443_008524 [Penicillium atrosanguineum]KAJ5303406.1 hypothetical protein N7476_010205 [Penicillium atrosanguineum]